MLDRTFCPNQLLSQSNSVKENKKNWSIIYAVGGGSQCRVNLKVTTNNVIDGVKSAAASAVILTIIAITGI